MDKFGENLKRLRHGKKMTLEELSNALNKRFAVNFNKGMLSKWENGHPAKLSNLKILALYFDITLNELLGFNEKKEKNKIPILRNAFLDQSHNLDENIIDYGYPLPLIPIKENLLEDLFYLKVEGDGMNREYPENSLVLVRKNIPVSDGDNVVLVVGDNKEATLIKIKIEDNILTLIPNSYNPEYLPQTINTDVERVKIIGKVIASIKYE